MKHAAALKAARAVLNLSRQDLSDLSGVGTATISRIEDGHDFKASTFLRLIKEMPEISWTDTDDGFVLTYKELPKDEDYMAALGPCGK